MHPANGESIQEACVPQSARDHLQLAAAAAYFEELLDIQTGI